jgi:type I restriction enzyme S subunit
MNQLPPGWSACSISEVAVLITKGTTPTSIGFNFADEGIRFVKIESLNDGIIDHERCAAITEHCHEALARSKLQAQDILFTIAGTLGRVAVVKEGDLPANTNQAVGIIRLTDVELVPYIGDYLKSGHATDQLHGQGRGTGLQNLNLQQVGDVRLLLPSLAEQRRIVAKLATLSSRSKRARAELDRSSGLVPRAKQAVLERR